MKWIVLSLITMQLGCITRTVEQEPSQFGYTPREARTNRLLIEQINQEVPYLPSGTMPAKEAFALLRIATKAPIFVDWEGLEIFGILDDEQVVLPGVTSGNEAILRVCAQLSQGLQQGFVVGYELVDGVVVISLNEVLDRNILRPIHLPPDSMISAGVQTRFKRTVAVRYESPESLGKMLEDILNGTKAEYVIDKDAIKAAGVDLNAQYSLVIGNSPADLAIHTLLRKVSRKEVKATKEIGYAVIGGKIFISTGGELSRLAKVFQASLSNGKAGE